MTKYKKLLNTYIEFMKNYRELSSKTKMLLVGFSVLMFLTIFILLVLQLSKAVSSTENLVLFGSNCFLLLSMCLGVLIVDEVVRYIREGYKKDLKKVRECKNRLLRDIEIGESKFRIRLDNFCRQLVQVYDVLAELKKIEFSDESDKSILEEFISLDTNFLKSMQEYYELFLKRSKQIKNCVNDRFGDRHLNMIYQCEEFSKASILCFEIENMLHKIKRLDDKLSSKIIPALREKGVREDIIRELKVDPLHSNIIGHELDILKDLFTILDKNLKGLVDYTLHEDDLLAKINPQESNAFLFDSITCFQQSRSIR